MAAGLLLARDGCLWHAAVALTLGGVMGWRYMETQKVFPAAVVAALSLVMVVVYATRQAKSDVKAA